MKKKVHLIGNAHLDPVWQWQWQEGLSEIKSTFRSVLDRMNEFPDFKFTCAGAMYYEWIEAVDPKMFAEIQRRVKEGRWCIAGGWYVQPDCNLPCGEAFVRQGLFSQAYFKNKFDTYVKVGYNVDSFGHGGIVQILKKSGLDYYVFMRPDNSEKPLEKSAFTWQGLDGSQVKCYRVPITYCIKDIADLKKVKDLSEKEGCEQMAFYGVGNHGGGPTIELLTQIDKLIEDDAIFKYSTVNDFFEDKDYSSLPVVTGDLQNHARGCYSLNTKIKASNRKAETSLYKTEVLSSTSHFLLNSGYPFKEIQDSWKKLLFCQFHDSLCGCVVKSAVEDCVNILGGVIADSEKQSNLAMQRISWNIDTLYGNSPDIFRTDTFYPFVHEKLGSPVVIFNSLPWAVKGAVKIYPKATKVLDKNDNVIPSQIIRGEHCDGKLNKYSTLIYTEVPAFGYKLVKIFANDEPSSDSPFTVGDDFMENSLIKVSFSKNGGIRSIINKSTGKEYLSAPTGVGVYDETAYDAWAHGVKSFDKELGKFDNATMHVVENGSVRATMRITSNYKGSVVRQDVSIYPDKDIVEVSCRVELNEKHRMLRFYFPASVGEDLKVYLENQYGYIDRPNDNGEYPCGKWFSIFDDKGGICIANDSKYSFSVDKNVGYMTVLRTAIYCDHYGERDEFCDYMDTGIHDFNYSISPFKSFEDCHRVALEQNVKLSSVIETFHNGVLPQEYTGVSVDKSNISISAFKRADDGNGYILRAFETDGKETSAVINLHLAQIKFEANFTHNEIKTFRILENKIIETDLIERNL
ncbi:MAG: alpha-mannosidase [Clostridiales bacterium]|nr:alpha-mannosidase [Clostridiales bacterium]